MPFVKIEICTGHTSEYKKTLLQAVHDGLQATLDIPDWDRYQRLYELDADCFEHPNKTEQFCMIEITMFPGRTKETKHNMIEVITNLLHDRLQISRTDVFIVMHELPFENWGFGGKQKEA